MKTTELDFQLPPELIAQHPAAQRDASRLLVVERATGAFTPTVFREIGQFLRPGDCLVMNNTRVIRARLTAHKDTGGKVEVFLLREQAPGEWLCLLKPSAKAKPGARLNFPGGLMAEAGEATEDGKRIIRFAQADVLPRLEEIGAIPLPPYIHREQEHPLDAERYQTVVARKPGAVAAPTAGLHYTPALLDTLRAQGVQTAAITLHVGYGTFKPVQVEDLAEHSVDAEDFELGAETAQQLNAVRAAGGRIVAVGTTATRVLETQWRDGAFHPGEGQTRTYIYPPYNFRGVDALQTNFHLPKSSLLALAAAFAGKDLLLEAYRYAIAEGFRFYSYGDAMLIL
jgi:S-adenosylmethionine:tRNA ribosyltransferase-isomerase